MRKWLDGLCCLSHCMCVCHKRCVHIQTEGIVGSAPDSVWPKTVASEPTLSARKFQNDIEHLLQNSTQTWCVPWHRLCPSYAARHYQTVQLYFKPQTFMPLKLVAQHLDAPFILINDMTHLRKVRSV